MTQHEKDEKLIALGKISIRAAEVVDLKNSGGDLLAAIDDLGVLLDEYNARFGEPEAPEGEGDGYDSDQFIIVYGNPVTGVAFEGPFPNHDAALHAAERVDNTWWIAELHRPLTEEAPQ